MRAAAALTGEAVHRGVHPPAPECLLAALELARPAVRGRVVREESSLADRTSQGACAGGARGVRESCGEGAGRRTHVPLPISSMKPTHRKPLAGLRALAYAGMAHGQGCAEPG